MPLCRRGSRLGSRSQRIKTLVAPISLAIVGLSLVARADGPATPQQPLKPQDVIQAMIDNENSASARHERWEYISNERSGRTNGHLWTERVVETAPGRLRLLLGVDGRPLTPQETEQERARLEAIREHPETFIKHEQNTRAEEKRARQMMEVLPHDFVFEDVVLDHGVWHMTFRPNPGYSPSGIEERVLHNMAGTLAIDAHDLRLVHMDFHVVQEVSIGFGLLGDIHKGTNFISDRQEIEGHWHTMHVATQVHAKALLFKSVDLNVDLYRTEFQPLDRELSVPEAAALLLAGK
jgi:hypothetical protein